MSVAFGNIILDTPEAKIFEVVITEDEAVNNQTNMLFAAGGMTNFNQPAQEKFWVETTDTAIVMTIDVAFSIFAPTTMGFQLVKTSAAGVGAIEHTFRVYMHARRFYQ